MNNPASSQDRNLQEDSQISSNQNSPSSTIKNRYQQVALLVRLMGFACCLLSAGIAIYLFSNELEVPPLVFGAIVLVNAPLLLAIILALLCPILFLIALFLRPVQYRGGILKRICRAILSAIASTIAIITLACSTLAFVIDEPYLLDPPSTAGDRILIVEHHFLLLSSGTIYYVPAGSITVEENGSFLCDDSYSPVQSQSYSLSWNERTAHLEIWSDSPSDPMNPWIGTLNPS